MELTHLTFIAYILYIDETKKNGYIPVKWLCLNDETTEHYIKVAQQEFDKWVISEKRAEERRNEIINLYKY